MRAKARTRAARRITERDLAILAWLARQRFATARHVAERFGIGVNRCSRRLGELAAAGCVERRDPFLAPSLYLVTAAGLALVGSDLPVPRLDLRTYRHDKGITELLIDFELRGERVLSEREMRVAEANGSAVLAARLPAPRGCFSARRHFPDLLLAREDNRYFAIELELTSKRTERLTTILKAYRRSPHIARVVYYVDRRSVKRRVERIGADVFLGERLEVRPWRQR